MLSVIVNLYFRQAGNRKRNDPHNFEGNASEIILPEQRVNDVLLNTCTIQAGCAKTPTDYGPSFHSVTASNPGKQCESSEISVWYSLGWKIRAMFLREL